MLVAAVLVACGSPDEIGSGPIAQTTFGPVQGRAARDGFVTYHGIPFATPPIGELRWRPPRDPTAWSTPLSALWPGPQCPHLDVLKGHVHGNEDCLRLSVYVPPACTPKSPCAVMQWIYGGAWTVGSEREFGLYDATKLALKYSVVVVAANYRLDALGWLALQELQDESPSEGYSNYGLRDQQLALKWTQRNVGAFGGDPKRVTIFGESAGGFSVCQHLVSPASDRLFSRAIMQSGSCDGPFMILDGDNAKEFGDSYTAALGCPRGRDRLACMRKWSPAEVLVPYIDWLCLWKHADPWCSKHPPMSRLNRTSRGHAAAGRWPSPVPPMAPLAGWTAVVDGVVLPDTPLRMIRQGRLNHGPDGTNVSVIAGTNHDEMALFAVIMPLVVPGIRLPFGHQDAERMTSFLVQYHDHWNASVAQRILEAYPLSSFQTAAYRMVTFGTDFVFRCGTRELVRALSDAGIAAYLYDFNHHFRGYIPPDSLACQLDSELLCGVYHSSEIKFIFQDPLLAHLPSKVDLQVSAAMGLLWTNMAKYGSPNGAADVPRSTDAPYWPQYRTASDMHLEISGGFSAQSGLAKPSCDVWSSLPPQTSYPH